MIGFFDSGLGGLTILHEVMKQRPGTYLYLSDNARAPYGSRSQAEILEFTTQGVKWLIDHDCSLVIIACNTSSANALRTIQETWLPTYAPNARVLGIIVPTVESITGIAWSEERTHTAAPSILIFATPSTVSSGSYEREIRKRLPNAKVVAQACPDLVPLIESGAPQDLLLEKIKEYITQGKAKIAGDPEVVLLGCTHYALVEGLFSGCLPKRIQVLSQPNIVTQALLKYLQLHPEHAQPKSQMTTVECFTTAEPNQVTSLSRRFFRSTLSYRRAMLGNA